MPGQNRVEVEERSEKAIIYNTVTLKQALQEPPEGLGEHGKR